MKISSRPAARARLPYTRRPMGEWMSTRKRRPSRLTKNADLLARVLGWVDADISGLECPEPALAGIGWDQVNWFTGRTGQDGRPHLVTACAGCAACILAGAAAGDLLSMTSEGLSREAAGALGLTRAEAELLFTADTTRWQLTLAEVAFNANWRIDWRDLNVPPSWVPRESGPPGGFGRIIREWVRA
jgi:hypothetical protein